MVTGSEERADWLDLMSPCPRVVGRGAAPTHWVEPWRVIYDHELVLFESGSFVVDLGGETLVCPPGSFVIVPPGRSHLSRMTSLGPGRRLWVHFDWLYQGPREGLPVLTYHPAEPQWARVRPAPPFVPGRILTGSIPVGAGVYDLHERLYTRWHGGTRRERAGGRGLLLELLVLLLHPEGDESRVARRGRSLAECVRDRLGSLATAPTGSRPSVRRELESLGCSYAHACRRFKAAYGIAPLQYVNALRIERAKRLLLDTDLPVSEVARRTGFDTLSYFSRLFHRLSGHTPRAFRRRGA